MRTIEIRIVVEDSGTALDINTYISASSLDPLSAPPSTMEIVGIMEMAKKQFITAKESGIIRVPDHGGNRPLFPGTDIAVND